MEVVEVPGIHGSAVFSPDGRHRYRLERELTAWLATESGSGTVLWVMLNPSLAGAHEDDPTIRKVRGFSAAWGFQHVIVANLFSLITPYPRELLDAEETNGPHADAFLKGAAEEADKVVCAWGNPPGRSLGVASRTADLWPSLSRPGKPAWCLGRNASGTPKHPGRIPYKTELERFDA